MQCDSCELVTPVGIEVPVIYVRHAINVVTKPCANLNHIHILFSAVSVSFLDVPQFEGINSLMLSFFMVQLSHLYMTAEETMALAVWTFVSKVMYLLFNVV